MHAEIGRRREAITINTPLADIAYDDATGSIGEDLISTAIAGDDWGGAWDRVARTAGTVADLRDELYSAFWDLDPSRAWVRFIGEQTVSEWRGRTVARRRPLRSRSVIWSTGRSRSAIPRHEIISRGCSRSSSRPSVPPARRRLER